MRAAAIRSAPTAAQTFALRPGRIGEPIHVPEPDSTFGPLTTDQVRQLTGGIGYEFRWPEVGELSLGLQKTDYGKNTRIPAGARRSRPRTAPGSTTARWRSISRTGWSLCGYTRGLEESGVAPANAVNRNSAPPALRTSQRDAGIRYAILPR